MTPKRPYLLRAFYEWIVDNSMTPYITVDATAEEVSVPRQHVKDGRIVLNIVQPQYAISSWIMMQSVSVRVLVGRRFMCIALFTQF